MAGILADMFKQKGPTLKQLAKQFRETKKPGADPRIQAYYSNYQASYYDWIATQDGCDFTVGGPSETREALTFLLTGIFAQASMRRELARLLPHFQRLIHALEAAEAQGIGFVQPDWITMKIDSRTRMPTQVVDEAKYQAAFATNPQFMQACGLRPGPVPRPGGQGGLRGMPAFAQGPLGGAAPTVPLDLEQVFESGIAAYDDRVSRNLNPFDPTSDAYRAWDNGWIEGRESFIERRRKRKKARKDRKRAKKAEAPVDPSLEAEADDAAEGGEE